MRLHDLHLEHKVHRSLQDVYKRQEEDRTKVIKEFAMNYFDNMVHINLKNNQEIREYINTMPTGRDAYYFIEKAVHDMIVPLETILIFNNADSCRCV